MFRLGSRLCKARWKNIHYVTVSLYHRQLSSSTWSMTIVCTNVCASACKDLCCSSNDSCWSHYSIYFQLSCSVLHFRWTHPHTVHCILKYMNCCVLLPFALFPVDLFRMVLGILGLKVSGRHEVLFMLAQCTLHFVWIKTEVYNFFFFFVKMFLCTADWYRMENIFYWDWQLLFERFVDMVYILTNHMKKYNMCLWYPFCK